VPLVRKESATGATSLSGRSRAVLERGKMLALRSIKELEFDRAMGKIAQADYDEMSGRLRRRAMRLIQQLDANTSYREQIETELAALVTAADAAPRTQHPAPSTAPGTGFDCPSCGTGNDADARFCKQCGTSLKAS
jgi:hypothetical protein